MALGPIAPAGRKTLNGTAFLRLGPVSYRIQAE